MKIFLTDLHVLQTIPTNIDTTFKYYIQPHINMRLNVVFAFDLFGYHNTIGHV